MQTFKVFIIPALFAGIFCSCGRNEPQPVAPVPATTATPSNGADQSYTVRAIVDALPSGDVRQSLSLHHEAIPSFVGKSGTVTGMKEMIMPFQDIAPGVSLAGIAVGDPVEVDFEVRWNQPPRTLVTRIAKLPPGTKLNLSKVTESK
ncbi:MAG: copper-binding protein [Planctomycetes bacterium]|nr:copper-binding protein [Planctomycetota bacterium]